jgi:hypothetical protein
MILIIHIHDYLYLFHFYQFFNNFIKNDNIYYNKWKHLLFIFLVHQVPAKQH